MGKKIFFCHDSSLSKLRYLEVVSVWLWLYRVEPINSLFNKLFTEVLGILCY